MAERFELISKNMAQYAQFSIHVSIRSVFENVADMAKKYIRISNIWGKKKEDHDNSSILSFEDFHTEFELTGLITVTEILTNMKLIEENEKASSRKGP